MEFVKISDGSGKSYLLPENLLTWMLSVLQQTAESAVDYVHEDYGRVCEIDPNIADDVSILLEEISEYLAEE